MTRCRPVRVEVKVLQSYAKKEEQHKNNLLIFRAQKTRTMNRDDLLELKARMENALENDLLEDESFDINEFEEEVCTIEQDLEDYLPAARDAERKLIASILRLITKVKDEYEFFDAEAERSALFPNGEDDY